MAITKGAKKAHRASLRKKAYNDARKRALRGALKALRSGSGDKKQALSAVYQAIDKALKTGLIKKNTAARRKAAASRLAKA
jgi:small subunit ribosomal protein S20